MKIDLKHLLDYSAVVQQVIDRYKAARRAKVGEVIEVPAIRTRVAGQYWEESQHTLKRLE